MKKPGKPKPKRKAHKSAPARAVAHGARPAAACAPAKGLAPAKSPAKPEFQVKHVAGSRDRKPSASAGIAREAIALRIPFGQSAVRSIQSLAGQDRFAFGLLLLPFLVVALTLTMAQSRRAHLPALPEIALRPPVERVAIAPVQVQVPVLAPAPVRTPPPMDLPPPVPSSPAAATAPTAPIARASRVPAPNEIMVPGSLAAYPPPVPTIEPSVAPPTTIASLDTARIAPPVPRVPAPNEIVVPGPLVAYPPPAPVVEPPTSASASPASARAAVITAPSPDVTVALLDQRKPVPLAPPSTEAETSDRGPSLPVDLTCSPSPERLASFANVGRLARARLQPRIPGIDGATFGRRLAAAAVAQTEDLVIYTARYQPMAYPLGDVMPLHGACIDVVIRAYRTLGIDLQEEIQKGRPSRGDTNIDHRRTENLRRFLDRAGASVPISSFPEDYKPGDIVTYHRPFSRISTSHIAVVTDVIAPTRRPMIVHNRGYGPQLEDALFVDRITGHYRYMGPPPAAASPAKPTSARATTRGGNATPVERASFPAASSPLQAQRAAERRPQ